MRKTLVSGLLFTFFYVQSHAAPHNKEKNREMITRSSYHPVNNNIATAFNVRIGLVTINGTPVSGSAGLRGFWAKNEQTGVYIDATNRDGNEFEGLPAGTYTFGAYNGNWDGAVPQTVTLSHSQEGPDGFIPVTLVYWVE
ncbi:hypothetical protein [Chitinophaga nivalis]|uniref:Carboxypeptidase regulatory-like domain-containing protein n=1 Tax=Chitinophaga nivalis TaxID=2991709 RepID=A0ABT3IK29_9BACT|nr:hypothetical protein [Chitinophaga nivalis]MCW3465997.1 hypothetical protein [Chitinophaga nivalis]MCW3484312.1 hypothetical protein [Chitinophaga nivalis]